MLDLRAGPAALAHLRANGLRAADIRAVAGTAGGPKWLFLGALDRWLFGEWLRGDGPPVELVGASAGAWRFAAACRADDPAQSITALETAYSEQTYSENADRAEITATTRRVLVAFFDERVQEGVLSHPRFRLTAITAHARGLVGAEGRAPLITGSALAAVANAGRRRWISRFFQRSLFQSPGAAPVFADDGIATRRYALTTANAFDAVYASGSIPWLMSGVRDPDGAPSGVYRDGGIIDYHIDHPLADDGIVLMPHFSPHITPGWFDKFLGLRKPAFAERTLVVAPGPGFLARLPNQRIPDRKDFYRYAGQDAERLRDWRVSISEGERFAEAFRTIADDEDIAAHVQPL